MEITSKDPGHTFRGPSSLLTAVAIGCLCILEQMEEGERNHTRPSPARSCLPGCRLSCVLLATLCFCLAGQVGLPALVCSGACCSSTGAATLPVPPSAFSVRADAADLQQRNPPNSPFPFFKIRGLSRGAPTPFPLIRRQSSSPAAGTWPCSRNRHSNCHRKHRPRSPIRADRRRRRRFCRYRCRVLTAGPVDGGAWEIEGRLMCRRHRKVLFSTRR